MSKEREENLTREGLLQHQETKKGGPTLIVLLLMVKGGKITHFYKSMETDQTDLQKEWHPFAVQIRLFFRSADWHFLL